MIRVVIADDHRLVRQSIISLFDTVEDMEIVGEAADGYEALALIQRTVPDVAVMDMAMPLLNGIEAIRRIQSLGGDTHVIALSMYSDETMVRKALKAGASGYLPKHSVAEELLLAIRTAGRGETYLSPLIARMGLTGYPEDASDAETAGILERLSSRERALLQLVVEGHTNWAAAHILHVGVKTVERHRANLMRKLNAHSVPELVRIALKNRLIFPDG